MSDFNLAGSKYTGGIKKDYNPGYFCFGYFHLL